MADDGACLSARHLNLADLGDPDAVVSLGQHGSCVVQSQPSQLRRGQMARRHSRRRSEVNCWLFWGKRARSDEHGVDRGEGGEVLAGKTEVGGFHDVLPDHGRVGPSVDLSVRGRWNHGDLGLGETNPHRGGALWGVAGEDGVGVVLGGPRFAGSGSILQLRPPACALVDGSLEDPRHLVGQAGIQYPGLGAGPRPEGGAVGPRYPGDVAGSD